MEVESLAVNSSPSVGVATTHINGPRTPPAAPHRTPPVVQVAVAAQRSPSRHRRRSHPAAHVAAKRNKTTTCGPSPCPRQRCLAGGAHDWSCPDAAERHVGAESTCTCTLLLFYHGINIRQFTALVDISDSEEIIHLMLQSKNRHRVSTSQAAQNLSWILA
jgi:hypothetical protein